MSKLAKAKYQKINKTEQEVVFTDTVRERPFDFTSINDYSSIFNYKPRNSLRRHELSIDSDSKPLKGVEKYVNLTIIGLFYAFFIILLPFSLLVCLKKVKKNEKMVVYRLGRIKTPAYEPGYCILFPLIDSYHRLNTVQKEFCIPNLQILSYENAIIDLSTQIRYRINDVIKMTNSLQDLNSSIRSLARGILFNLVSKKDVSKVETERNYIAQDLQTMLNETVRKWGIEVISIELTINSIIKDESNESGEDPALRSLSLVFKSLFNNSASSGPTVASENKPGTSGTNNFGLQTGPDFLSLLQGMTPFLVPTEGAEELNLVANQKQTNQSEFEPFRLLKLVEPLLTDNIVKEINTVYEFHIKSKSSDPYKADSFEVFYLDLKSEQKSRVGMGQSLFAKTDCIIKLCDEDLKDLLTDKLKPFTAYLSGRIEIDGDLQDVFKLKKLIKLVPTVANLKTL